MGKRTEHKHPKYWLYLVQQIALIGILLVMGVAALGLLVIAVILPAPLFVIMALLVLALAMPIWMLQTTTAPVELAEDALTLCPLIGGQRRVAWEDVLEVRPYPLLPAPHQETGRKLLIGRDKYQKAEGIMLIVRGLPPQYRIGGFFCGVGMVPVVAFTNRTHADYPQLVQRIRKLVPDTIPIHD